jgi:hypothetical protein
MALPITPLGLPDPGPPPTPVKTITRWDQFLGDIAAGCGLAESMQKRYICRADIETMCRLEDGGIQRQRYEDARSAGLKRVWSIFQLEDIFGFIAEGKTIEDAQMLAVGKHDPGFARLIISDPELNAKYRQALEVRALGAVEHAIAITDDMSRDTLPGPKGGEIPNMAAVSRDKLRAEMRLRVAGNWNSKLYSEKKDQINVQINVDHAATLEADRTRAKSRGAAVTPKQLAQAIDATFSEKTDLDTTWMDEKPTDPQWREET